MPKREITYLEGIRQALQHSLRTHPETLLFGQDVGPFGGAFKVTLGLQEEFGKDRVFDTPISESAMVGVAIGMATQGLKPIVELQFVDFSTTALHQLLNNAGTVHYRVGHSVPLTLRGPCGGGFSGGPFHSEELEAFFVHMPGVKVVYPAFPSDARGLLYSSILDPNPVIYLENKFLYRHVKEMADDDFSPIPLGKARVCRGGTDAVILTYGAMVHEALQAAEAIAKERNQQVMVVDLRTLKPYDEETIGKAVAACHRVLVAHEGWRTGGFGAEISAFVAESHFQELDAPIRRVTAPDVPVPFAPELEKAYRPNAHTIKTALIELLDF